MKEDRTLLRMKEYFGSIQGEGWWQGRKATFVRFAGCNLKCEWCDTLDAFNPPYLEATSEYIYYLAIEPGNKFIVLTGGEPLIQYRPAFISLVERLVIDGYSVAIETNGTQQFNPYQELAMLSAAQVGHVWITVSPKPPRYELRIATPDEIKIVEDPTVTPELLDSMTVVGSTITKRIIQPQSCNPESFKRCLELQEQCPDWLVRLQMHRIMEVR